MAARVSKWSALGNTYLVTQRGDGPRLVPARVRELCAGTDGIVEVIAAANDNAEVVIWNRDGSTAELSGNGTRIVARWLADRTGAGVVRIRVGKREVRARMLDGRQVETDLGLVKVGPRERIADVDLVRVSVGNPHAVIETDPEEIGRLGPLLVRHSAFPDGTNVEAARVVAPGEVEARVWERGVGETAASGTGAVAVAAATHGDGEVRVRFPGGELDVRLERGRAFVTGPAERTESSHS